MKPRLKVLVALVMAVASLSVVPGAAAAGDPLDPGFGQGGISLVKPPESAGALSLIEDASGRLFAAGSNSVGNFVLARYSANGALDPSFGNGFRDGPGYVDRPVGSESGAEALGLEPDGGAVAAGAGSLGAFVLARFDPSGAPEPGFGKQGLARINTGGEISEVADLAVTAGGRVVVVGSSAGPDQAWHGVVSSFRPDGSPDSNFGKRGVLRLAGIGSASEVKLGGVLALPERKLLIVGQQDGRPMLLRLLSNGKPDPGFGGDGRVLVRVGGPHGCGCDEATGMVLDSKRRIVVSANETRPKSQSVAVLRFNSDGTLDRGFGNRGVVYTAVGRGFVGNDVTVERDGRIVVVGEIFNPDGVGTQIAAARYTPQGRLDPSFGRSGIFRRRIGVDAGAAAVVAQAGGGVVVAGVASLHPSPFEEDPSIYDDGQFLLMRLKP